MIKGAYSGSWGGVAVSEHSGDRWSRQRWWSWQRAAAPEVSAGQSAGGVPLASGVLGAGNIPRTWIVCWSFTGIQRHLLV